MKWEVFRPVDGQPVYITKYKTAACFVAWLINADYEKAGEGWIDEV
jgi:hypothetical protein